MVSKIIQNGSVSGKKIIDSSNIEYIFKVLSDSSYISQIGKGCMNGLLDKMRELGLFIMDIQNNKSYPNRFWYNLGYTDEDMLNHGFLTFVHPEDYSMVKESIESESHYKNVDDTITFRIRTKEGLWRWVLSSSISVTRDNEGRILQYIGFDIDITEQKKSEERTKAALLEAQTLHEISTIITSNLDFNSTISAILDQTEKVIPFDTASVQILKGNELEIVGGSGWENSSDIIGFKLPVPGKNPNTKVINSKESLIINDISKFPSMFQIVTEEYYGQSWLGIPLLFNGLVIGMLTLDKREKNFFTMEHQRIGKPFADHVAIALENARIYEEVKNKAITDSLTGAKTRRSFIEDVEQQQKISKRYGTSFSIIMMDIDFFKNINDRFGHKTGDEVLKDIVTVTEKGLREPDILCRYGGEEFIILLPQNTEAEAFKLAERIRKDIANNVHIGNDNYKVTASFGCTAYDGTDIQIIENLISQADQAMYLAKSEGRNCSRKFSEMISADSKSASTV